MCMAGEGSMSFEFEPTSGWRENSNSKLGEQDADAVPTHSGDAQAEYRDWNTVPWRCVNCASGLEVVSVGEI